MDAYCFKCGTQREIPNQTHVTLKNGRTMTQGICPVCGTRVFRIGKGQMPLIKAQKVVPTGAIEPFLLQRKAWPDA